jgi:hypothetical protein
VQTNSRYQGGRCREFDIDQISLVGFPTYALAQISLRAGVLPHFGLAFGDFLVSRFRPNIAY